MKSMIKIQGIEQLMKNSKNLAIELDRTNRNVFNQEADKLVRVMKGKAPQDKGNIRDAIRKKIWKDENGVIGIVVGITKESSEGHPEFQVGKDKKSYYPASQEYGWEYPKGVFHKPHPYVRPAFDKNVNRIRTRVRKEYKGVIDRAGK